MPAGGPPRLIGFPFDAASSFQRGAALAPRAIRAALHSPAGNSFTEGLVDLSAPGALTDAGDLTLPDSGEARGLIERGIALVDADGARPIALGGDHSVTYPILRALAKVHTGVTVLHIDAHPDLYDEFEGDKYSHACPFARVMEEKLVRRLVQVGIRCATAHQVEQARRFGVEMIDMKSWAAGKRPALEGPVYLSLDIDGIDPAFAPGVSHREPGGLSVREVLTLIHGLPQPLIGADVVELNPARDVDGMTAVVAAKLVKEIAGRMLEG